MALSLSGRRPPPCVATTPYNRHPVGGSFTPPRDRGCGSIFSVPASIANYLKAQLGRRNTVKLLQTKGYLPHLSAPGLLAQVLRRVLARC
jgi:hypothetical protein